MLYSFYKTLIWIIRVTIKAFLVLFIVVSIYLCFCSLIRNYEKFETKKLFSTHYDYFIDSLDQSSKKVSIFNSEKIGLAEWNRFDDAGSITIGIFLILLAVVVRYGAELEHKTRTK